MKRKLRSSLCVLPVLAMLVCGAYALTAGDSLISLSYLRETFLPSAQKKGAEAAAGKLDQAYNDAVKQLEEQEGGTESKGNRSETLESRSWSAGDTLILPVGSGFLLLNGEAQVSHNGAVVDVTAGKELTSGTRLISGHRCLTGENTETKITVLSGEANIGIQGAYTIVKGSGEGSPFYDVCTTDWYYEPVTYIYRSGLFSGMEEHIFGPDVAMNRAMLMTVLYRLASSPERELADAQTKASFVDVPDSQWYAPYVLWGAARGITAGTGDGMFSPELKLNREQLVVLLYSFGRNYLGMQLQGQAELSEYKDLEQVHDWAREGLSWGVSQGIIGSTSTDELLLSPRKEASRAEVATMLRAFSVKVLGKP